MEENRSIKEVLELAESADIFLNSLAVQDFISTQTNLLYEKFLTLNVLSTPGREEAANVIHKQNILAELVAHMRYLRQMRDKIAAGENYEKEKRNRWGGEGDQI